MIIEPFAGSARYALRFYDKNCWINDTYEFSLPGPVDLEKITSKLEDGVLTIVFPKTEQSKGREIKVE